MQISLLLMQQIAQLFLILLMGYAVVKTGLLKASDSKVLSVVFVYLVMPCVVLNAFQIKDTLEIRTGLLYSMGIAVGMHVVFLLLNALFRKALKLDAVEQVNVIYSNAAALVIPIVQALLGEEWHCLCRCTRLRSFCRPAHLTGSGLFPAFDLCGFFHLHWQSGAHSGLFRLAAGVSDRPGSSGGGSCFAGHQ